MRILWANEINDPKGDGYGYSYHTRMMREALTRAGIKIETDLNSDASLAVHIAPSDFYIPVEGKKNLLFTMVETATIPRHLQIEKQRRPDIFVVPCEHNRRIFKQFYRGTPVYVCPEGIVSNEFPFFERKEPSKTVPFRFLFVGALNERKGFKRIADLFNNWFALGIMPQNVQLYLKTTNLEPNGLPEIHYLGPNWKERCFTGYLRNEDEPERLPSMVIDQRNISTEELRELYNSAHAFILPTSGEGWGLTLTEAMATGLPCTWTHWSGPVDYADNKTGYPLTKFRRVPTEFESGDKSTWAEPDRHEMLNKMKHIYNNYPEALKRGAQASERMHTQFTWDLAAARFIEILEQVQESTEDGQQNITSVDSVSPSKEERYLEIL